MQAAGLSQNPHFRFSPKPYQSAKSPACLGLKGSEGNNMLLLTNCEVHEMKLGPYKKLRSEYFPCGTNNLLIRALLNSHHEVDKKFSDT